MRPKAVEGLLRSLIHRVGPPAVFIWGPPGVGKSAICRQAAEREEVGWIDARLSLMDPTDLRGIPVPENGTAKWLVPSFLPRDGRGILFLDEINLAPTLVQSSAYQLIFDRRLGEYVLPEGWAIVAAGNGAEHGAHVYKMAAPLRNRFVHVNFEINHDDWRAWAIKNNIASEVIEFISFSPDFLFKFDPKRHENAFSTPRSWEFVSRILKGNGSYRDGIDKDVIDEMIGGAVGDGSRAQFNAFLDQKKHLPDLDEIFNGKNYKPNRADLAAALVTALAVKAEPKQFERLMEYGIKVLDADILVLMIKLMAAKDKKTLTTKCPAFIKWSQNENHWPVSVILKSLGEEKDGC